MDKKEEEVKVVKQKPKAVKINDGKKEYTVIKKFKVGSKDQKEYKINDKIRLTKKAYLNKKRQGLVK